MAYNFYDLEYTPTDYKELKIKIIELTKEAEKATSVDILDNVLVSYDKALEETGYNYTLAYSHSSLDSSLPFCQRIRTGAKV